MKEELSAIAMLLLLARGQVGRQKTPTRQPRPQDRSCALLTAGRSVYKAIQSRETSLAPRLVGGLVYRPCLFARPPPSKSVRIANSVAGSISLAGLEKHFHSGNWSMAKEKSRQKPLPERRSRKRGKRGIYAAAALSPAWVNKPYWMAAPGGRLTF